MTLVAIIFLMPLASSLNCGRPNSSAHVLSAHDKRLHGIEAERVAYLDVWGKKVVRDVTEDELARLSAGRAIPRQTNSIIPLRCSRQPASAGTGMYLGPEEFDILRVLDNDLTARAAFAVPVRGNSMEPRFHDDILLVEEAEDVPVGEIGVFTLSGAGYVKKRGVDVLHSLNPEYEDVPLTEDSRCNGRVIGTLPPEWIR